MAYTHRGPQRYPGTGDSRILYMGGKAPLLSSLLPLVPPEPRRFVEPFGGMGAMSLAATHSEQWESVIYSELGESPINLIEVLRNPETARELAEKTKVPVSLPMYDYCRIRAVQTDAAAPPVERAYRYLVALQHGIFGGCGKGQKSGYKPLQRFRRFHLFVPELTQAWQSITVQRRNAFDLIREWKDSPETFIYLDPPYIHEERKRSDWSYPVEMSLDEHRELLELIEDARAYVMLSGYPSSLYNERLAEWNRVGFDWYSTGRETVWMNY